MEVVRSKQCGRLKSRSWPTGEYGSGKFMVTQHISSARSNKYVVRKNSWATKRAQEARAFRDLIKIANAEFLH